MPRLLTHKRTRKRRSMIQVYVRGVAKRFPIKEDGARSSVEMSLQSTQNNKFKRRKIVKSAKLEGFEPWQQKIFAKNAKQGWRFFQPDTVEKPTPRSSYEAWGGTYRHDDSDKKESRNQKIMFVIVAVVMILLSII